MSGIVDGQQRLFSTQTKQDKIYMNETVDVDFEKRRMKINLDKTEYMYIEEQHFNIWDLSSQTDIRH